MIAIGFPETAPEETEDGEAVSPHIQVVLAGPDMALSPAAAAADAASGGGLGVSAEARCVVAAQLLFGQRVKQHRQQHKGQGLA